MKQLHKKFTDFQIKDLITRYLKKKVERKDIQKVLGIKKTRFFALVKRLKDDPENFSILYFRKMPTRGIPKEIEKNIIKKLKIEKDLIKNKEVPIKCYNYHYIKDILEKDYKQKVSLTTIINRAKDNGFYLLKQRRKAHDREVLTNYTGEIIQHDSSHHQFSTYADSKWYLITSLDDYSRLILYASLVEIETAWVNIIALKVDHQWKQVLNDCRVKVTYTLSPQTKGKIERPYRWIQDKLARTCYRKKISDIN